MDYIRARREVRHALVISDPQPVENVTNVWLSAGQAANIGIFPIGQKMHEQNIHILTDLRIEQPC